MDKKPSKLTELTEVHEIVWHQTISEDADPSINTKQDVSKGCRRSVYENPRI